MREIIFRGMTKDKKWLFGDVSHRGDKVFIFPKDGLDSYDNYEVIPETVGQYTGLKDKNGNMIFEGDKLTGFHGQVGYVHYEDGSFKYSIDGLPLALDEDSGEANPENWATVSGNIHEVNNA